MHNNHIIDHINKDLSGQGIEFDRKCYLKYLKDWIDPFGLPEVVDHEGFMVVRDDLIEFGSKCRFGDYLVKNCTKDTLVYVQPRCGFAGISLSYLANKYNKRLVLFMPSSKEISDHQAICIERGAIPKFRRIAAMPNLNKIAKKWAEDNNAFFIPLGLVHMTVTAAIINTCDRIIKHYGCPKQVWCAISTGVLSRGLQIGFHKAEFHSVAVARNLKEGELGRSKVYSHPKAFTSNVDLDHKPPFPSASNYDAKVWQYMKELGQPGALMWNVAGNVKPSMDKSIIDSYRDWGEIRD